MFINVATAGHKLQGQTKKKLVRAALPKIKTYDCIALSCMQTRKGHCSVEHLPHNTNFSMSDGMRQMIERLKQCLPAPIDWNLNEERNMMETRQCGANCYFEITNNLMQQLTALTSTPAFNQCS